MTQSPFPVFDGEYKPEVIVIDGVPTICHAHEVLDELTVLEPGDDRTDGFVAVPVRSVWNEGCGPAVEIGPFTLDDREVVKLYNALTQHINNFPSQFRFKGGAA